MWEEGISEWMINQFWGDWYDSGRSALLRTLDSGCIPSYPWELRSSRYSIFEHSSWDWCSWPLVQVFVQSHGGSVLGSALTCSPDSHLLDLVASGRPWNRDSDGAHSLEGSWTATIKIMSRYIMQSSWRRFSSDFTVLDIQPLLPQ